MTYIPGRDERFEYVWDLMHFIEDNQCKVCVFRKTFSDFGAHHAVEYPMCPEIESQIITESPVESLDDKGAAGVVCTKFKQGDPPKPVDPDQLVLGE